ncbi:MAG: DUF3795 domain-containing protein [Bacteroidetes bacterium]|nr:DUF3795 domain-containing protein [Bacteroidota bacterium]
MDLKHLTAPCGLPCFACNMFLALNNEELRDALAELFQLPPEQIGCLGCRDNQGKCAHLPMKCRVYPCVESKNLHNCSECDQFPCDLLHPYRENAIAYHNTKIFNLCLIKKMGIEEWSAKKASSVLYKYSHGKWTL